MAVGVCSHPTQGDGDVLGSMTQSPVLSVALPGQRVLIRPVGWSWLGCPRPQEGTSPLGAQREQEGSQETREAGHQLQHQPLGTRYSRAASTVRQCRVGRAWAGLYRGMEVTRGPTGVVAMAGGTGARPGQAGCRGAVPCAGGMVMGSPGPGGAAAARGDPVPPVAMAKSGAVINIALPWQPLDERAVLRGLLLPGAACSRGAEPTVGPGRGCCSLP